MDHAQIKPLLFRAVGQLEETAGIGGRDGACAGGLDVFKLSPQELIGHLWLREIVNARAAATPRAFRKLGEFQTRD